MLAQFPIVGTKINVGSLHGSVIALIIGLATSLLAGLGVTQAAQNAFDRVWAVPFKDRPDFLHSRLRGLMLLVVLGALFIFATLASGLVTGGLGEARWSRWRESCSPCCSTSPCSSPPSGL